MLKFLHIKWHIQNFLKLFQTVINLTYVQSYKEIIHQGLDETPCILHDMCNTSACLKDHFTNAKDSLQICP
jgi:hypothetical protein